MRKKMIKQKLIGVLVVAVSIISSLFTTDDTFAVLAVIIGLYLIFSRRYWIY